VSHLVCGSSTDLYAPVKKLLEEQAYTVRGESIAASAGGSISPEHCLFREEALPLLLPLARNGVCQLLQLHRLRLPSLQNRLNDVRRKQPNACVVDLLRADLAGADLAGADLAGADRGIFEVCLEGLPVMEDGPEDVDASASESNDGLVVAFSFPPFAVVEGAAVGGV
jgi:hypothetical protein